VSTAQVTHFCLLCEAEATRRERAERTLDALLGWRLTPEQVDSREESFDSSDNTDWMTREDAIAHYECALLNWGIILDERDREARRAEKAETALALQSFVLDDLRWLFREAEEYAYVEKRVAAGLPACPEDCCNPNEASAGESARARALAREHGALVERKFDGTLDATGEARLAEVRAELEAYEREHNWFFHELVDEKDRMTTALALALVVLPHLARLLQLAAERRYEAYAAADAKAMALIDAELRADAETLARANGLPPELEWMRFGDGDEGSE